MPNRWEGDPVAFLGQFSPMPLPPRKSTRHARDSGRRDRPSNWRRILQGMRADWCRLTSSSASVDLEPMICVDCRGLVVHGSRALICFHMTRDKGMVATSLSNLG